MRSLIGSVLDAVRSDDQAGIRVPVPMASARGASTSPGTVASMTEQMRTTSSVGTLFSIVNRTSTSVAAVDWHMHRLGAGMDAECPMEGCGERGVTLVESHPALEVLNDPNPFYTRSEYIENGQQHVDLTGECWTVVAYTAGRPTELWNVRPDRIAPVRHPTKFIDGYVYVTPDGEKIPLPNNTVMQIRMPNPLDPYRGLGPVQAVMTQIDSARYSAAWNRNFFRNSAIPGGVIEIPNELTDDEWNEFQYRWAESHRGVENAHRVALIERGGVWKDVAFSQKDMQFAELGKLTREEMREAFGIHGHMLGLSEDINLAAAKAADTTYAKYIQVPRLDRWKAMLNKDFLRMFGNGMGRKNYAFAYCSPVPADVEEDNSTLTAKSGAAKTFVDAGWYGPSVAEQLGLPEMVYGNPEIDPSQQLLVDIVKAAPSLFPVIGPMLGYELPEPPAPEPAPSPEPGTVEEPTSEPPEPEPAPDEVPEE